MASTETVALPAFASHGACDGRARVIGIGGKLAADRRLRGGDPVHVARAQLGGRPLVTYEGEKGARGAPA
jgi:hypothetical protein